jgi:methylthioribose-1-phosphate isomerase
MAATFKPDYMTNDKLEAATKGHGSLVIPVYGAANSLAEDVFCAIGSPEMSLMSSRMTMVDAAAASLPLDMVIEKAVRQAALAGAAPENAALIVAALAYFRAAAPAPASRSGTGSSVRSPACMPGPAGRARSR